MSDVFGAAGAIAGSAIQANAVKEATQMQIDALQKNRDFVYNNLDPAVINQQALQADTTQAANRLALQGKIDPQLLAQRYSSEAQLAQQAAQLGNGPAQAVGNVAAAQAIQGTQGAIDSKNALIDAALKQLDQGATLPPDVQAELVQTGLEKTGQMTQTASAQGFGGQMLRKIIGTAGINLQMQRQQQAADLATKAQGLEQSRSQILGNLFPNLSSVQLNTLQGTENVLKSSNDMLPSAGLSGANIANIWAQRVGATGNINQQIGQVGAQGALGQATAWAPAISAGATSLGNAVTSPTAAKWLSHIGIGGNNSQDAFDQVIY